MSAAAAGGAALAGGGAAISSPEAAGAEAGADRDGGGSELRTGAVGAGVAARGACSVAGPLQATSNRLASQRPAAARARRRQLADLAGDVKCLPI